MTYADSLQIVVGMPVTYCIGSDRYPGKVVGLTESRKTLHCLFEGSEEVESFRWSTKRSQYRGKRGIGSLLVGVAERYMDPSF